LLFDVIATAYERNSLIVTTNLPFQDGHSLRRGIMGTSLWTDLCHTRVLDPKLLPQDRQFLPQSTHLRLQADTLVNAANCTATGRSSSKSSPRDYV